MLETTWSSPSPEVAELIRAGVRVVIDAPADMLGQLDASVLRAAGMGQITQDEALTRNALDMTAGNIAKWATSNLESPGERVPVDSGSAESQTYVRELVRRGLDSGALDAFRTSQNVAWQLWMAICFELTDDPGLLKELLAITSASIGAFIDDTVGALAEQIDVARAELAGDTHAQRRAATALLLEGAPVTDERAEAQLHYRLAGPQLAAVVSGGPDVPSERLEAACEALMSASGITSRLIVLAGAAQLWVWFPVTALDAAAASIPAGVQVAIGAPGTGREGFRRSHFQALTTHRLMQRLGTGRQVAAYDDLRLADAMSEDDDKIDDFIASTLGDLDTADPELAECLRIRFAERCNASATAARLFTHRNTVVRRLARAEELLPVPLADHAIAVAAALELRHWRGTGSRLTAPADTAPPH
ncbi:MAG: helix-turn-helix domain-containing protein [Gordonia sp. (in: high G+C Gram-positive bacteria)]|uniref:PucR family transcriptional regulator n=1 Tax=Gordonia sp. (in: high G+C Gram-positive bacteria) TaxID=84139 RepID=UPI0039E6E802